MLLEVLAAFLLLAGSGVVFYALLQLERTSRPANRPAPAARPVSNARKLPRAA